jgi:hypothetical protein
MVADAAGGVGGEAWSCDGQTNGINFIQFVCPSPWLPAVSTTNSMVADVGGEAVNWKWIVDHGKTIELPEEIIELYPY